MVFIEKTDDRVCLYSNLPLSESSRLELNEDEQTSSFDLEESTPEDCEPRKLSYQYQLEKKYLAPSKKKTYQVRLEDIFGQTESREISIRTDPVAPSDFALARVNQLFYQNANQPSELHFDYYTQNLRKLRIQACKVSADQAIRIESKYIERWFSFAPDTGKCIRYNPVIQDIDVQWGQRQDHTLALSDMFDDITPGLYYIYIHAPNLSNEDGEPIETNILLQYSNWNIYSKRGDSALVWLTDYKTGQPVADATIKLISTEGTKLEISQTNSDGIYFIDENLLKYEYIMIKKGSDEALLNVFAQEGYETSNYSVAFNYDDGNHLYQFYLENPERHSNQINGVFLLRSRQVDKVVPSEVKSAVLALYNENEEILWREFVDLGDSGDLYFKIKPKFPLLDGTYNISVCVGLHQGVCHGTNFWTSLTLGDRPSQTAHDRKIVKVPRENAVISIKNMNRLQVGDKLELQLSGIKSDLPLLLSVERDSIFIKKLIFPSGNSATVELEVSPEMIPEAFVSIIQFHPEGVLYDIAQFSVDTSIKKLPDDLDSGNISKLIFQNISGKVPGGDWLLSAFYPQLGTSVITAASRSPELEFADDKILLASQSIRVNDSIIVDGDLIFPGDEELENTSKYVLAHDDQGNFANLILRQAEETPNISIRSLLPKFIRPYDQIIFDLIISNNSAANKNLQLVSFSENLDFSSDKNVLFGLQADSQAKIGLVTRFGALQSNSSLPLQISVNDNLETLAQLNTTLDVAHFEPPFVKKKNIIYQSASTGDTLIMPIKTSGLWKRKTYIATSPISFVLENLRKLLERESLQLDEVILKSALSADYRELLKSSLEEEDEVFGLLDSKNAFLNELYYLELHQKNDGGWSRDSDSPYSDPILTSWIAKALSIMIHGDFEVPEELVTNCKKYLKEQLDELVNRRVREEIDKSEMSANEIFQELLILNALSSITPSGVSYANNWYSFRDILSNEAMVLLLLTFEDYRDANLSGTNFKIEELIQQLKARRELLGEKIWLEAGTDGLNNITDFIISAWYLEALVRQASARSDIPALITWLVANKYEQSYQTPAQQFSFLHAMSSYLYIFQENITASNIRLEINNLKKYDFDIADIQKFKSYSVLDYFLLEEDEEEFQSLSFTSDKKQALFIEVNLEKQERQISRSSQGLSIYQRFDNSQELVKGEVLKGSISIISPRDYANVVLIHPQIAAVEFQNATDKNKVTWQTKVIGPHEKWYIFDKLEAGETVIEFEGIVNSAGVFTTPQAYAYLYEQPEIHAVSNSVRLELKQ